MSNRLMVILIAFGLLLLLVLFVAWLDGGEVEQRQIVEPVLLEEMTVPESNQ